MSAEASTTQAVTRVRSRTVCLPDANIDTDRIIPARFLTTTTRAGLGTVAFNDWRYREDGTPDPEFALNRPEAQGAQILVAGRNFGCGSSREHAPWALLDFGLRAVISAEIADIFRSNSLKNGLLPIVLDAAVVDELLANPGIELDIDVAASTVTLPDGRSFAFPIDGFARTCLLEGVDQLGYLLKQSSAIQSFEEQRCHAR
ncbi:3-isopropylmalate dehydratase small subunit [Lysobacter brunescens]|uniref:3-isopropylmalate dehydratase small subunit n=1 Tax=Lysobacter brunescens TaxID=262323 RepID=A0ABW2Y697_9GAMM